VLSFVLALAAAATATLAGREAVRVARLSAALGTNTALLTACWLACALGSGAAAWLGTKIGARLAPDASAMVTATALLVAAGDLALLRPVRAPAEPTRSFGAIVIVLGTAQLTSAVGFLILAVTTAGMAAELAALAGAVGSGAVLTAAWRAGRAWETRLPLPALRWTIAGLLLLGAGLSARGLLD
jgi:hypothetical protein